MSLTRDLLKLSAYGKIRKTAKNTTILVEQGAVQTAIASQDHRYRYATDPSYRSFVDHENALAAARERAAAEAEARRWWIFFALFAPYIALFLPYTREHATEGEKKALYVWTAVLVVFVIAWSIFAPESVRTR